MKKKKGVAKLKKKKGSVGMTHKKSDKKAFKELTKIMSQLKKIRNKLEVVLISIAPPSA